VHLGFKALGQFGRGTRERTVITVHKDRPGFLPGPRAGLEIRPAATSARPSPAHARSRPRSAWTPAAAASRQADPLLLFERQ
jgi:hypothetical protein